jgi:pimeloyl-ACP methyl ester carboxylesterase
MTIGTETRSEYGDYVEVEPGRHLYCRHAGAAADGPLVLLVHGNRDNHSHFAELQRELSGRHTVAVDLRGHGLSSDLDRPLTPELLAADLRSIVEHYSTSPVVLAGHSLGSVAAMVYADRWPDSLAGLVLMGSAASFTLSFRRPEMPLTPATFPAFVAEANRRAAPIFFHDRHPEVARRVQAAWSTISLDVHRHLVTLRHPDLRDLVQRLRPQTLVVAGEHDRCTTPEQARWIVEHHRRARLVVVPATGHFMYLEDPRAVAAALEDFLSELDHRGLPPKPR